MKALLALSAVAALLPAGAPAQAPERQWAVDLRGGALLFDQSSAIGTGAAVGVDALFFLSPRLAVGPTLDYALATTDGSFFVGVIELGADSLRIYDVAQVVGALSYGVSGRFELLPGATFSPYLAAGGGGYRLYLDAETMRGPSRLDGAMLQAGGGIRWTLGDAVGLSLDARDLVYLEYDRERLNPVDPRHRNRQPDGSVRFPAAEAELPEARSTLHNFRLALGFTYVPGQAR